MLSERDSKLVRQYLGCGVTELVREAMQCGSKREMLKAISLIYDHVSECAAVEFYLRHGYEYCADDQWTDGSFALVMRSYLLTDAEKDPPPKKQKRPDKRLRPTFIYVIRHQNGLYKIGQSKTPKARERTLQAEDPALDLILQMPGVLGDELILHERFAPKRKRGEWFELSSADLEFIKQGKWR